MLNIPPQAYRGWKHLQFEFKKMKPGNGKTFGEYINHLVDCGDESNGGIFVEDLFPHKVVVHFNVLGASMIDRVRGKGKSTNIVTPDDRGNSKRDTEFTKQHLKPVKLGSNNGKRTVFNFRARPRDNWLLLSAPRDERIPKEDSKAICGTAVIRAPCPIRVTKGIELQVGCGIKETMVTGVLKETKNMLGSSPVCCSRMMQVLVELIH
jgi:hypothetical protein